MNQFNQLNQDQAQVKTRPIIVGISGGSGSGKTALSQGLVNALKPRQSLLILQDNYYKHCPKIPIEQRRLFNFDHPQSIDFELLEKHLLQLKQIQMIQCPQYDFVTHLRLDQTTQVNPQEIILLDGMLLLTQDRLMQQMDLKVFVDAKESTRYQRRLERDIKERGRTAECIQAQFQSTVAPMHNEFIQPNKFHADLLVDGEANLELSIQAVTEAILKIFHTKQKTSI